ncbi:MAG: signal peptidase I [Rickettsiaceae bacterium]|nr:signal peptidase I [Rickettsiaceae bacterium]
MSDSLSSPNKKSNSWKKEVQSWIQLLLFVLCIKTFVFENCNVPTESLKPTILKGDYVFVSKYSYGYSKYSLPFFMPLFEGRLFFSKPERGEIIVFWPPKNVPKQERFVKRLIGLPGDKIEIIEGVIHINDKAIQKISNGKFIDEEGNRYNSFIETLPNDFSYEIIESQNILFGKKFYNAGPYNVPSGHYFFMGDNRDDSADSRSDLGFIMEENLIAKAQILYFSAAKPLFEFGVSEWWNSIRWERIFSSLYTTPEVTNNN